MYRQFYEYVMSMMIMCYTRLLKKCIVKLVNTSTCNYSTGLQASWKKKSRVTHTYKRVVNGPSHTYICMSALRVCICKALTHRRTHALVLLNKSSCCWHSRYSHVQRVILSKFDPPKSVMFSYWSTTSHICCSTQNTQNHLIFAYPKLFGLSNTTLWIINFWTSSTTSDNDYQGIVIYERCSCTHTWIGVAIQWWIY